MSKKVMPEQNTKKLPSHVMIDKGSYAYQGDDVRVLDNSKFERDLKRYWLMVERRKKELENERVRQRKALRQRIYEKAEERMLARERAEEEARSRTVSENTVSRQLVKEEADAILAETQETLDKARSKEADAIKLLAEARLKADEIQEESRARSREEAEAARSQAVEQGKKEGMEAGLLKGTTDGVAKGTAQGLQEGRKDLDEAADKLEKIIGSLPDRVEAAIRSLEEDVVATVRVISQRVIAGELSQPNEVIVNIVKEALGEVRDRSKIIVRVNAADVMACRRHRRDFLESVQGHASLRIVEDASVKSGGCLIDTEAGRLDARIETRSEAALKTLDNQAGSGGTDAG